MKKVSREYGQMTAFAETCKELLDHHKQLIEITQTLRYLHHAMHPHLNLVLFPGKFPTLSQ